jgi:hypothetical protein
MDEMNKMQAATAKTKKPSRGKVATKRSKPATKLPKTITPDLRHRIIAEAAYYRAESRGFAGGDPELDWLEAESEVDALLLGSKASKS